MTFPVNNAIFLRKFPLVYSFVRLPGLQDKRSIRIDACCGGIQLRKRRKKGHADHDENGKTAHTNQDGIKIEGTVMKEKQPHRRSPEAVQSPRYVEVYIIKRYHVCFAG